MLPEQMKLKKNWAWKSTWVCSTGGKYKSKRGMKTIEEETKEPEPKGKFCLTARDLLNDSLTVIAFPNTGVLFHLFVPATNSHWTWNLKNEIDYDRSIDKATS